MSLKVTKKERPDPRHTPRPGEARTEFPLHREMRVAAEVNYFEVPPFVLPANAYRRGMDPQILRTTVTMVTARTAALDGLQGLRSLVAHLFALPRHLIPGRRWQTYSCAAIAWADRAADYELRDRLVEAHLESVPNADWVRAHRGRIGFYAGTRAIASGQILLALDHPRAFDALAAAADALGQSVREFRSDVEQYAEVQRRRGETPSREDQLIHGSSSQQIFTWDGFMASREILADAERSHQLRRSIDEMAYRTTVPLVAAHLSAAEEVAQLRHEVVQAYVERGLFWALYGSASELALEDATALPGARLARPDDSRHADRGRALLQRTEIALARIRDKRRLWDEAPVM